MHPPYPLSTMLTRSQTAELIGHAEGTLRHWSWRARKGLPLAEDKAEFVGLEIRVGRSVRYKAEEVLGWLHRRRSAGKKAKTGRTATLRAAASQLAMDLRTSGRFDLGTVVEAVARTLAA